MLTSTFAGTIVKFTIHDDVDDDLETTWTFAVHIHTSQSNHRDSSEDLLVEER